MAIYWQAMCCDTVREETIKRIFSPLCDDMEPESCDVLCDTKTDREKKVRAIMVNKDGERKLATRALGGKQFSMN